MTGLTIDRINGLSGGLAIKAPVLVATTGPITLSGLQTIDGVALVPGDRVLVKDQADPVGNGIWTASTSSWSRALDMDGTNDAVDGTLVTAAGGTSEGQVFQLSAVGAVQPGVSSLTFSPKLPFNLDTSVGATLIGFKRTGTGATDQTVDAVLQRLTVHVAEYGGATSASAAVNQTAFNNAISAAASGGGGYVDLDPGIYRTKKITTKSKVILRGKGSATTTLYLEDGEDTAVVEIENYATLVGSDTWLVADGCPQAYGLEALRINGNKANQTTAVNGVNFYGKRLHIDDVLIVQCKGEGWHSESNYLIPGAPNVLGEDMPEGLIRGLYIWECDSHGFVFRGQHDTYVESLFSAVNGGWGVRFESDATAPTVYSGNCDSGFMHIYANTEGGIYIGSNCSHRGAFIISESNFGVGLDSSGWQVLISQLQLYGNCRTTGTYQALIAGSQCRFSSIHVKDTGQSKSGVSISGLENTASITAVGAGSTGIGVNVVGVYQHIDATISGYSGVGGIGLQTGSGTQLQHSFITATLNTSKTGWNNASTGANNTYNITGYFGAGQAVFSGNGPNVNDQNETWNVKGSNNGTMVLSESRVRSVNAIDLNSTTQGSLVIPHGLVATPEWEDISLGYVYQNTNTTWIMSRPPFIAAVDATNVTVKWKLSTAAGGSDFADIIMSAKL